jgi:hypothetical protein
MEMELMRHQQELEQAELERALAMSIAVEEERLKHMVAEAKKAEDVGLFCGVFSGVFCMSIHS